MNKPTNRVSAMYCRIALWKTTFDLHGEVEEKCVQCNASKNSKCFFIVETTDDNEIEKFIETGEAPAFVVGFLSFFAGVFLGWVGGMLYTSHGWGI